MRAPLLFAAAVLCAAPSAVIGQVSVTQSTAGVPLSQNGESLAEERAKRRTES